MSLFTYTSQLFRNRKTEYRRQERRRAVRKLAQIETLEDRRLLAVDIEWIDQFGTNQPGRETLTSTAFEGGVLTAGWTTGDVNLVGPGGPPHAGRPIGVVEVDEAVVRADDRAG